jgi:AraC-like DNA-binding protein
MTHDPRLNPRDRFFLLAPPYERLADLSGPSIPDQWRDHEGVVLVWSMAPDAANPRLAEVASRPRGLGLVLMLPPSEWIEDRDEFYRAIEHTLPDAVLPFLDQVDPGELEQVLREPPDSVAGMVLDHLAWRGCRLSTDTRRLVHRTLEASTQIQSVQGLARGMYLSRRALGRRFAQAGLPVPSRWLQLGRVLHAAIRLQAERTTLHDIARDLGYADGFALSNQMDRLVGTRPSSVRERLGRGWIVDAWIRRELATGGFEPAAFGFPDGHQAPEAGTPPSMSRRHRSERVQPHRRGSKTD